MPRSGPITRRSGDPMAVKNLWSHLQDALAHALSGIDRQARTERLEAAGMSQQQPRSLVSGEWNELG